MLRIKPPANRLRAVSLKNFLSDVMERRCDRNAGQDAFPGAGRFAAKQDHVGSTTDLGAEQGGTRDAVDDPAGHRPVFHAPQPGRAPPSRPGPAPRTPTPRPAPEPANQ